MYFFVYFSYINDLRQQSIRPVWRKRMKKRSDRKNNVWHLVWFVIYMILLGSHSICGNELSSMDPESTFTAYIISDLHYTHTDHPRDVIVPLMAYADEAADAIINEVIARKPDVFILNGDNTNSGAKEDASYLAQKLQRVKDAGIQVILTTGNHDFNMSDADDFEEQYFFLLEMADRDPASLSYVSVSHGIVFLAMDDNSFHSGKMGEFSPETMRWLNRMLDKYQGSKIIFLSHHNVLVGRDSDHSSSYRIQNASLAELLSSKGVRLIFTGHLHSQMLEEENGMFEVVSSMPYSGLHQYGILSIHGNEVSYHTRSIDWKQFGSPELIEAIRVIESNHSDRLSDTFREIIRAQGYTEEKTEHILALANRFLYSYQEGTLGSHLSEITSDPSCEDMIEAFWDYNYGPWMKSVLESDVRDASSLSFTY